MEKEKRMLEGFNVGYTLQKYQPSVMDSLKKDVGDSHDPFFQGMVAGSIEMQKERQHRAFPGISQNMKEEIQKKLRGNESNKNRDKGQDLGRNNKRNKDKGLDFEM